MPRQPNVSGSNGGPCASSSAARSAAPSFRRAITAIRSTTSSFVAPRTVSGSRARSWGKAAALEQEQLERDHRGGGRSDGGGHGAHRRLAHGLGDELARDEPEHRARGEAEADGKERRERLDRREKTAGGPEPTRCRTPRVARSRPTRWSSSSR